MTASPSHSASDTPWRQRPNRRGRKSRRQYLWAVASVLGFWAAVLALALPTQAHADANTLASYGATASGWAIQSYVLNDAFLNVPATDQAAPYVFVSMDNTPGAEAKAAYFFPGTAGNAVLNTQGVAAKFPNGIDARYPSNNPSTSQSVGAVDDQNGDAVGAATQSGKTSEGFAQAQAAEASYQFGPSVLSSQPPSPPPLPVVTPPPIPSTAPTPTPTTGGSGGGSGGSGGGGGGGGGSGGGGGGSTPTPSPTPCNVPIVGCLHGGSGGSSQASTQSGALGSPEAYSVTSASSPLPDPVVQALTTALNTLEAQNPAIKQLAQNAQPPTPNPTLPYAGGDVSSIAVTQATDEGVGVAVATHAANLQLFQGLITFKTVDSQLQGVAPASTSQPGSGKITTTITGASIAGIPVTIDTNGATVVDQNASAQQVQQLSQQLNAALKQAGVQIMLLPVNTKTDVGFWQGSGGGLEVTAELNSSGLPSPANGLPATHVDFTIAQVIASIYAVPGSSSSGLGSGGCFFCGGFGFGFPGTPGTPGSQAGGTTTIRGLSGGQLLAILFIIEGLCTGAVASAAKYSGLLAGIAKPIIEEETK